MGAVGPRHFEFRKRAKARAQNESNEVSARIPGRCHRTYLITAVTEALDTPSIMLKTLALSAVVASAAAFAPVGVPALRRSGATAAAASKFPQQSPAGAPPADLFNIWRDDYMLTPQQVYNCSSRRARARPNACTRGRGVYGVAGAEASSLGANSRSMKFKFSARSRAV